MLNREKLAAEIGAIKDQLFPDYTGEGDLARLEWEKLSADSTFSYRVGASQSSFLVPSWDGNLSDIFSVSDINSGYSVIAVDGSQVYPDRHISGAGCFLVNTGGVHFSYGSTESTAKLFSQPSLFLPYELMKEMEDLSFTRDIVDLKREELELFVAAQKAEEAKNNGEKVICLFDGTIIFWPLEGVAEELKEFFLERYLSSLESLYQNKIVCGGYISMSKSRELVNLIKLNLCRFDIAKCIECHRDHDEFPCKQVDRILDTHVAKFFITPFHRTIVFYSTSKIVKLYPEHLKPAFVYLDVGSEIVRIEMPKWVAEDEKALDFLCAVAIDQARKGQGYPVCLAEAHEQAVVKGVDREFFYHLIQKVGIENNRSITMSRKSLKKRIVSV